MAIRIKKIDYRGGKVIVTYKDDPDIREAIFQKILAWFFKYQSFSGESIMQSDDPYMDAPELLSDIADDIFEFDIVYEED